MPKILLVSLLFSFQLANAETPTNQGSQTRSALLCVTMFAQATKLAHDEGPMAYKMPVFSVKLDTDLMDYLDMVMNHRAEFKVEDLEKKSVELYTQAISDKPELGEGCEFFKTTVIGHCEGKPDEENCITASTTLPEAKPAAQQFALKVRDLLMIRTEMRVATDLLSPLAEKEEKLKASFAQFVANHYFKIIIASILFSISMVVLAVVRLLRR